MAQPVLKRGEKRHRYLAPEGEEDADTRRPRDWLPPREEGRDRADEQRPTAQAVQGRSTARPRSTGGEDLG
jgi:hypothetical protein